MKVLVTGGCGFIGSHLVRRLIMCGHEVIVFDNFSRAAYTKVEELRVVKGDVRFKSTLANVLNDVDVVFHLAALNDVGESIKKPLLYHKVNAEGTLNLLECCRKADVKKFIFTSTCAVYGEPVKLPINEEHPVKPLSPYAASKLAAEAYCKVYANCYDLDVLVFRLFNVYGPRQSKSYGGVISEFIKRVRAGKPPIIYGSGEQSRDFIHVDDVVECLVSALGYENNRGFELFNLGSGVAVTVNQLAEVILKLFGREDLIPIRRPAKKGEIFASCADVSKVEAKLGFRARVRLENGLKGLLKEVIEF
ncbi:MAG: NAD-dependent epimerase/dehydratase family protein [Nitrososphaerota archaeon]|nr:NAD-dependent epimerase/dehydratase family protein [Thermoproteota archaeon]